jgi:hypothetical protein
MEAVVSEWGTIVLVSILVFSSMVILARRSRREEPAETA